MPSHHNVPVNSNYKGFPACQAKPIPMNRGCDSFLVFGLIKAPPRAIAAGVDARCAGCGRKKLQAVTVQHGMPTADPDGRSAWATHSLAEFGRPSPAHHGLLELNGHCPCRSNLCTSTSAITRWRKLGCGSGWGRGGLLGVGRWLAAFGHGSARAQVGSLNASPLVSTAQARRAFFAAMATTAFQ